MACSRKTVPTGSTARGSVIRNNEPPEDSLSTEISPPLTSTAHFAMASPSGFQPEDFRGSAAAQGYANPGEKLGQGEGLDQVVLRLQRGGKNLRDLPFVFDDEDPHQE